jgi:Domain of unknown function (DUF6602)
MSKRDVQLKDVLEAAGKQLRADFQEIKESNPHAAEGGAEAEAILKRFLKERLPRRFDVESGLVIGAAGKVSRQTDLIIFDALNSPVYRRGPRVYILPRDNVAAIIEVKSKLNKEELHDAARKIASVKGIKAAPITNVDQPVTFSDLIMTSTLGCVFAFDSYTSLETLASNLKEINSQQDSRSWIDLVVVLDQGFIGYMIQLPFGGEFPGWLGGASAENFAIPPYYVHLAISNAGESTLNHFFVKLMAHLTFFRRRSTVDFKDILGEGQLQAMVIQAYQYNLNRQLVPAEPTHQRNTFKNPQIRFNIYANTDGVLKGQVCLLPWQDGAVITCSTMFDPRIIFQHYFAALKVSGIVVPAGTTQNMWFSSVLPISEEDFVRESQNIHPELITVRDSQDDSPPPVKINVG